MKSHLLATIVALGLSTSMALAESPNYQTQVSVNSASQAVANSGASAGAVAQGGSVTFNTPASQRIHNSGTTTIRSAPQVVAPSMSSGHPCAWSPLSVGVSVIGFGGALGGQRIDDACLLGQMQYREAAVIMIAQRNRAACRALEAAGNINPGSCGGSYQRAYVAPAKRATRAVAAVNGRNCVEVQATATTKKKVCG